MVPSREWKSLLEDGNERVLRKNGEIQPGIGRYPILSTM